MNDIATEGTSVARPLRVLVPLIKDDLQQGDEASKQAGLPYYRAAGEKMLEAKASAEMKRGEFEGWVKRNFKVSKVTAHHYIKLAEMNSLSALNKYDSMSDFIRKSGRPSYNKSPSWRDPVKEVVNRVNVDALKKERQNKERENQLLHKLSHQLIDIGYKVLASKLHPDKGGSAEAMARLNKVRSLLKEAI